MPLILGTNSIKDTGYDVANSLRLDDSSNSHLSKSISGTNTTKLTISFWTKRTDGAGADDYLVFNSENNVSNYLSISFGNPKIDVQIGGTANRRITNSVYRDQSAWYHVVITFDTTQSTASDRIKIYINGVQETSFATSTTGMSQDSNLPAISSTLDYAIGDYPSVSGFGYNGYLAEFCALYGQALDPTSFGEFDEDSPTIWKPKDVSGLTFGTNGFYLDFEDSSALGNDVSGNNNDFTANNLTAVDQSTDTCTNNFATLNPLVGGFSGTFSEGNTRSTLPPTNTSVVSNINVNNGKWYCEFKYNTIAGYAVLGVAPMDQVIWVNNAAYYYSTGATFGEDGTLFTSGTQSGTTITVSAGNVYGLMWDADNSILKITDGTDTFQRSYTVNDTSIPIGFFFGGSSGSVTGDVSVNFGNPSFSISSGNSDANGFGNFEYSVPSGFFSLCSKNLAESG